MSLPFGQALAPDRARLQNVVNWFDEWLNGAKMPQYDRNDRAASVEGASGTASRAVRAEP
jgi:hypothetical protein